MKKFRFVLLIFLVLLAFPKTQASADPPYTTWALGPGGRLFMTQDAYIPVAEVDLPISGAEDMVILPDGTLYVADTGKGRIVQFKDFRETAVIGKDVLQSPTGLFVDEDGMMYVADARKNEVFIFQPDGTLFKEFGRPKEPLFGKTREFLPRKIAVDQRKNLYIISEGSVNGVVQMNMDGRFIGYFGANTATMSLKMVLQRLFLTKEQLEQFVKNEAASPSNIAIDHQAMVYTITAGTFPNKSIRKFTIAGKNIFPDTVGSSSFRDVHVSEDGLLVAVSAEGEIYEYDTKGFLLFRFKAKDQGDQRMGTLVNPTAVARYQGQIYVLDKDKNAVVIYKATEFANRVHQGVRLYMEGYYSEAKPYFQEILTYNGSFILAYQALADAYFKERDFPRALQSYRYAYDRQGYSQAFWELRNVVLQKYLSPFILGLIGLSLAQSIFQRVERRKRWLDPLRQWLGGLARYQWVDDFVFLFRFIKQPADSFYYIKKKLRGSLGFAFGIYAWVVVSRVLSLYLTAFPFNPYASPAFIRVENEILYTLGLMFLWNAANYLVSTISDGEGRVRDVVIGTAYSLFPYALFCVPIALFSNVLTLNEVFIYTFSMQLMYAWVGLMLFLMVMEIHNYSFSETVRNILITLFTMGMFLLTGYILYVLFGQLFDFVHAILQEVRLRG